MMMAAGKWILCRKLHMRRHFKDGHVRLTGDRNNDVRFKTDNQYSDNKQGYFYLEAVFQEL